MKKNKLHIHILILALIPVLVYSRQAVTLAASATSTLDIQAGNIANNPLQNTCGNVPADFIIPDTLEAKVTQPHIVNLNFPGTKVKSIQLTYGVPTLAPVTTFYEYSNSNMPIILSWAITPNDEAVTDITIDGTSTGSTASIGSQAVTFKTIANGGTLTKTFPLVVTGNLYGAGTPKNSAAVNWDNRLYRGVITSSVIPGEGIFTFTDTRVKTELLTETKLGGDWKSKAGYDFTCSAGGQFIAFAYPDDAVTPVVQYWDKYFNSWLTYIATDLTIIKRTNFVNQLGFNLTNYKLVFVNVQYFNATVKIRLQ